jgi:uncharacterized protein (TIGR03437 family)
LIEDTNRARPGEVLHLYAQSLGPVSGLPPPGVAAPASPLATLAQPMVCRAGASAEEGVTADVLFAGLAPGMMGVYQIDVRMPATLPPSWAILNCQILGTPGILLTGYIP